MPVFGNLFGNLLNAFNIYINNIVHIANVKYIIYEKYKKTYPMRAQTVYHNIASVDGGKIYQHTRSQKETEDTSKKVQEVNSPERNEIEQ